MRLPEGSGFIIAAKPYAVWICGTPLTGNAYGRPYEKDVGGIFGAEVRPNWQELSAREHHWHAVVRYLARAYREISERSGREAGSLSGPPGRIHGHDLDKK